MVTKITWYLTLWRHPKVTSLTLGWKFYLHSVLLVISVYLIQSMPRDHVWFFWPLGHPHGPKSHPWGKTQATEWNSRLICFATFICENTHKVCYKTFEIDFVTEIKWYLTFWPLPRATGAGPKLLPSHAPFMWVIHTPNLVEFRPMVYEIA